MYANLNFSFKTNILATRQIWLLKLLTKAGTSLPIFIYKETDIYKSIDLNKSSFLVNAGTPIFWSLKFLSGII